MSRRKPNEKAVIVTDPALVEQIRHNDYGDPCVGREVNGVAYAEPPSVPAARRRAEDGR